MNETETIIIWGVPFAMPRPRTVALMTTNDDGDPWPVLDKNNRPQLIVYSKKHPAMQFKSDIRAAVQDRVCPYWPEGAIRVSWLAFLPRPKSLCRKKDPDGPIRHTKKPDRDNIDKSVLDALTGVVCKDDSQICSTGFMEMFYCSKPDLGWGDLERPHVLLKIEWLNAEEDLNGILSDHGYHPPQRPTQQPGQMPLGS